MLFSFNNEIHYKISFLETKATQEDYTTTTKKIGKITETISGSTKRSGKKIHLFEIILPTIVLLLYIS